MPPPMPPVAESGAVDFGRWRAGLSTPVADPIYPRRGNPGIDVLHYGRELAWAPESKTLSGRATLRMRAAAELGELRTAPALGRAQ